MTNESEALNPGGRNAPQGHSSEASSTPAPIDTMHKKKTLVLSVPERLGGLSAVLLVIAALVFLFMSGHTLYNFPAPDSYRWYGDETWLMLQWKNLILHGKMIVPIALQSTLLQSPGLLLGSSWIAALFYGTPQLLFSPSFDPISVGRTISFVLGFASLVIIGWASYRLKLSMSITSLAIALLVATRSFTSATHSARYDIITSFAILLFISFFTLQVGAKFQGQPSRSPGFGFWFGFVAMILGFTISPHLAALLILPTIFIAWYFGCFKNVSNILMLVLGAGLGFALLAGVYIAINHELVISGVAEEDNLSSAYLHHLPVLRLFSWSAQSHQLGAKLYYLWQEAPVFTVLLPLIFISEVLLLLKKRQHTTTIFLTICLFLVLVGVAFFQSTLPYYLIHFLPLATLAFAAHAYEWSDLKVFRPVVAIASLIIAVEIFSIWLPELSNGGRMGKRINDANTAAVQAAIEFASRNWVEGSGTPPLILAQGPAIHELLRDTSLRTMSEAFVFFPLGSVPVDSVLERADVNYIIDYDKPMTDEYEETVHEWKPIFSRSGPLLDRTLNYFHDTTSELDTLTLYERDSTQ